MNLCMLPRQNQDSPLRAFENELGVQVSRGPGKEKGRAGNEHEVLSLYTPA